VCTARPKSQPHSREARHNLHTRYEIIARVSPLVCGRRTSNAIVRLTTEPRYVGERTLPLSPARNAPARERVTERARETKESRSTVVVLSRHLHLSPLPCFSGNRAAPRYSLSLSLSFCLGYFSSSAPETAVFVGWCRSARGRFDLSGVSSRISANQRSKHVNHGIRDTIVRYIYSFVRGAIRRMRLVAPMKRAENPREGFALGSRGSLQLVLFFLSFISAGSLLATPPRNRRRNSWLSVIAHEF